MSSDEEETPVWTEGRARAMVDQLLDEFIPRHQVEDEVQQQRVKAFRYHLLKLSDILERPDSPPPRLPGQRDPISREKRDNAAAGRVYDLIESFEDEGDPVAHDVLLDLILHGTSGGHRIVEDAAILRALCGYRLPHVGHSGPDWPPFETEDLFAHCRTSTALDADGSTVQERVAIRASFCDADPSAFLWLTNLVRGVETLLQHRDWLDHVGTGTGRLARQQQLFDAEYRVWLKRRYPADRDLSDDQLGERPYFAEDAAGFRTSVFEDTKRRRVRFTLLYDVLGPAVLLDPTWTAENCLRASVGLAATLEALDSTISRDPALVLRRRNGASRAHDALQSLLAHIAPGRDLLSYLDNLFERCPPTCMEV